MNPTFYLAGAITDARDGEHGNEWRTFVQDTYDCIEWINPLDYEHPSQAYGTRYDEQVVERDEELILSCDGLIVQTGMMYQWGTPQEQYYAVKILGLPNVVVYDGDPADLSLWCRTHATKIVPNLEEAVEFLYKHVTREEYSSETLSTTDEYFVAGEYITHAQKELNTKEA